MKIDVLNAIAQVLELDTSKIAAKANVGDVLRVQVLASSENEAVLKMPDGKTITVGSLVDLNAVVGQYLDLVVIDKKDGKLLLETLKNAGQASGSEISMDQIKDLLSSLKLSVSPKNIEIVQQMVQRQVPVNKENIQTILNNLVKYPNLEVQKAVFMAANSVPFEEKSINLLNQYAESKISLGKQIQSIVDLVDNINDTETLKNIQNSLTLIQDKGVAKNLNEAAAALVKYMPQETENTTNNQISVRTSNQPVENQNPEENQKQNFTNINNTNQKQNIQITNENQPNAQLKIQKELLPLIKQFILDNIENHSEQEQLIHQLPELKSDISTIKQNVKEMNQDEFIRILNKLPESDKPIIEKLLLSQIIKNEELEINNQQTKNIEDINQLKSEIKNLFEKHFVKNTSENLAEDLHVNDSYKDVLLKLDIVKHAVSAGQNNDELLNLITQTEDNIKFMNNISQYNTFVQIPLNIWGQNTNGELYVLKKSRKKIDPNNASVFLSLEMPNMGLTEVLITVCGKNVACNFRLENDKIVNLVRKNAGKLTEAITKLGYSTVDIGCGLIQQKTNLLEMNKVVSEATLADRLTFDVKA